MLVFASQGPFGPTILGCLGLLAIMVGPLVVFLLVVRSFRNADPIPAGTVGFLVLAALGLAYFVLTAGVPTGRWGISELWQVSGAVAVLLTPAAVAWECRKRGWFQGRRDDDTSGWNR